MRGGVKGRLEFFRKFIRFGTLTRPLEEEKNINYATGSVPVPVLDKPNTNDIEHKFAVDL